MKQNIIKLIALYLLSIFIISCGSSDDGFNKNNPPNNNNNNTNNNDKTPAPNNNVVFTSPNKVSVLESQLNAITLTATGNDPIIYSISDQNSNSFHINSSTGVVVFKVKPDYETKMTYSFKATARDSKNNEDVTNVIISIIDIDEESPLFLSSDTLRIKENTLRAVIVKTKDDSIVTYSISNEADGSQFDINSTSGEITFKKAPDYESKKISYSLNVIAKDAQNNQSNQNINITILNIEDETKPIWISLKTAHVNENQLDAITLKATDNSPTITYSIIEYVLPGIIDATQINGDDGNIFNVGHISGKVTFKKEPDYESKKSYRFTAEATDLQGNKATQDVIISIDDVDEIKPKWVSSNIVSVQENQLNALTLKATDKNDISYSISGDDSDKFDISNTNGVAIVSFTKEPDYESKKSYSFTATAKDSKDNVSTQEITINITDIADETPPVWESPEIENVKEGELNATKLKATDENEITYSILEDNNSFNVDSEGLVTFKRKTNYQRQSSYKFTARATDKDGNFDEQNITINITFVDNIRKTFRGHASSIHSLSIMPSGGYVLSGSGDNTLKLWDINTGKLIKTFTNHTDDILSVAITVDEKYIILGSGDKTLKMLDINTTNLIRTFADHTDSVHSIALSADGKYIVSGGGYQDKSIKLWDINTGALKRTFTGHTGGIHSVAISPNGKYIVSGSNDESIKLWDIDIDNPKKTFNEHIGVVDAIAISPNGKYIVSGSNDESIKLWNIDTGDLIRTFNGHTGNIFSISITPNGKYILSGSGDNILKLWELNTGKLIRTFEGHIGKISSTAITPDGKYALSGSWDNTIKLWDINIDNL